jgi:hypothetical protein
MSPRSREKRYGAKTRTIDLSSRFNFPRRLPEKDWWRELAERVRKHPAGSQRPWGILFEMAGEKGPRAILAARGKREVVIELDAATDHKH